MDGDETIAETGGSIHYVSMPNLIYIGINDSRTLLSDVRFRQMLAAATDRDGLLGTAYYDRAQETAVPFPASWEQLAPLTVESDQDFEQVQSLLASSSVLTTETMRVHYNGYSESIGRYFG